jgi:hypothetical protein
VVAVLVAVLLPQFMEPQILVEVVVAELAAVVEEAMVALESVLSAIRVIIN